MRDKLEIPWRSKTFCLILGVQIIYEHSYYCDGSRSPEGWGVLNRGLDPENTQAKAALVQTWLTWFWSHGLMFLLYTLLSLGCTGNMQLWRVNQCEHLFASRKQGGEPDGLLGMQTTACEETFIYSVQEEAQSQEDARSLQELCGAHISTLVCVCRHI